MSATMIDTATRLMAMVIFFVGVTVAMLAAVAVWPHIRIWLEKLAIRRRDNREFRQELAHRAARRVASAACRDPVVLLDDMTIQDLARALQHSGYAVSNTGQANLFVVKKAPRRPIPNAVACQPLAFHRRQAD